MAKELIPMTEVYKLQVIKRLRKKNAAVLVWRAATSDVEEEDNIAVRAWEFIARVDEGDNWHEWWE